MSIQQPNGETVLETIHNPATGDSMEVLRSALAGNKEAILRFVVPANSPAAPPLHYHRTITETFIVESGQLGIQHNGKKTVLTRGQSLTIRPGKPHQFWNAGFESVRFRVVVTPGADFERFMREMYRAAQAGAVNRSGMPKNLRRLLQLIAWGDIWIPNVPVGLQKFIRSWLDR